MRSVLLLLFHLLPLYLADPSFEEQFEEWETNEFYSFVGKQKEEEAKQQFREMGIGHCMTRTRLSPIDIDLGNVTIVSLPELNFDGYHGRELVTESVKTNFSSTIHGFSNWTKQPILSGGPLNGNYHLVEVYWDPHFMRYMGSPYAYAHTVNGAMHQLEIYLVHTKDGMALEEAQKIPGAVATVASFVDVVHKGKPTYEIPARYNNRSAPFQWAPVDFFLSEKRNTYFVYNGTLTHPPCNGSVTWIVLANPVKLGASDLYTLLQASGSTTPLSMMRPKGRTNPKVLLNAQPIVEESPIPVPESSKTSTIVWAVIAAVVCVAAIIAVKVYYFPGNKSDSASKGRYSIAFDNQNFGSAAQITPFSLENPLDL